MSPLEFEPAATRYSGANAAALAKASALAYEPAGHARATTLEWGFPRFDFFDDVRHDTQAFLAANDAAIIVAFRGTEPTNLRDWHTDIHFAFEDSAVGKVHRGFLAAFGDIWQQIEQAIASARTGGQSLWFTGHSLGAALATLGAAHMRRAGEPVQGLYTFGQPRVGNVSFTDWFADDFGPYTFRFVNNNDVVPRVPPTKLGYEHCGALVYFDEFGNVHADLGRWALLKDRLRGRLDDLLKPGTDGAKDHDSARYVKFAERNAGVNPFA